MYVVATAVHARIPSSPMPTLVPQNPDPGSLHPPAQTFEANVGSEVNSPFLHQLGGSWVVISGVISRVTVFITHIRGLITPLITTHEPPRR